MFNVPITIVLASGQNLTVNGGVGLVTNGPIDVRMLDGLSSLDVVAITNVGTAGSTLQFKLESSPDTITWTPITSFAAITTTTSIIYTNIANTNTTATDAFLIPGTYTNYSATANLGVGTVLLPLNYTNGFPITLTNSQSNYKFSVDPDANSRYFHIVWQSGGAVTNWSVSATLTSIHSTVLK